jgi:hypothetical protein
MMHISVVPCWNLNTLVCLSTFSQLFGTGSVTLAAKIKCPLLCAGPERCQAREDVQKLGGKYIRLNVNGDMFSNIREPVGSTGCSGQFTTPWCGTAHVSTAGSLGCSSVYQLPSAWSHGETFSCQRLVHDRRKSTSFPGVDVQLYLSKTILSSSKCCPSSFSP